MLNHNSKINNQDNRTEWRANFLAIVVATIVSVVAGLISSLGDIKLAIGLLSIIVLIFFIFDYIALLWFLFLGGIVITGVTSLYFPEYSQTRWVFSLSGFLLYPVIFIHSAFNKPEKICFEVALAYFFIIFALFSLLISDISKVGVIIGLKNYFQVWSLMFAFYYFTFQDRTIKKFIKVTLILAVIQFPFVLHQFFILVPKRITEFYYTEGLVAFDIVVGTFVGSVQGGGGNTILSLFLIFCLTLVLALYRKKQIKLMTVLLFSVLCLFPIMINETKTSFIFIPIALIIVFLDKIKKSPIHFISGSLFMILFLGVMLFVYSILPTSQQEHTVSEYFESSLSYNIGDVGHGGNTLNRKTVLYFWLEEHKKYPIYNAFIGHGLASAYIQNEKGFYTDSLANRRYPNSGIGLTTISSLLWDVGIIGLLLLTLLFYRLFKAAWKLSNNLEVPVYFQAVYQAVTVGILLSFLSLFFTKYFVFEIGFQTLVMFFFGITLYGKNRFE